MNNEELIAALDDLNVTEMDQLIEDLEDKWGIERPNFGAPVYRTPFEEDESGMGEQTEFEVILESFPADKKVSVIKCVREITGLGLKEAKEFAENAPKTIAEFVEKDRAAELEQKLTEAGAKVILK